MLISLDLPAQLLLDTHTWQESSQKGAPAFELDVAAHALGSGGWAVTHDQILPCSQDEWRYLLSGGAIKEMKDNPAPAWLNERAWGDILALSSLKNFSDFDTDFAANLEGFRTIFDSPNPHRQVSPALSA